MAFNQDDMEELARIVERGKLNGCEELRLIDQDEIRKIAPGIGGVGGMLSPRTSTFSRVHFCGSVITH